MRVIQRTTRGCGEAVPGGFYLSATSGPGGVLSFWTWILGQGTEGGANVYLNPPERFHTLFNLPYTLATMEHQTERVDGIELFTPLDKLKQVAILDHVGSNNYTPWQFHREILDLLPSRRISPEMAAKIAPLCPLPIVFTHDEIPVVSNETHRRILLDWALDTITKHDGFERKLADYGERSMSPTWWNPKWGMRSSQEMGSDHWLVPVLKAVDLVGGIDKIPEMMRTFLPPEDEGDDDMLSSDIQWIEQPFGASWITRVQYICKEGETDQDVQWVQDMGVEPVRLSDLPAGMQPVENQF